MAKYQGKFNQNRDGHTAAPKQEHVSFADLDLGLDMDLSFLDEIELEQQPAPTRKTAAKQQEPAAPARKPVKKAPAEAAPVKKAPVQRPAAPVDAAPAKKPPVRKPAAAPEKPRAAAPAQQGEKKAAPKKQTAPVEAPVKKNKKKGPRVGGVIFYTMYFLFILVFFIGTYIGLQWLHGWLSDFEQAQPTYKAEAVFQQLFTDPDWGALYDAAGAQDSAYEGKAQYVNYMEEKMGSRSLTYMQTSAGLSSDKKYIVLLDKEKVATFTLVDKNEVGEASLEDLESITDIPDWQLGSVEVFFERIGSYRIEKVDGHIAYVNGVALDETFTIQMATTLASEKYLPEGTVGASMSLQEVNGLMEKPEVRILDKAGNEMELTYDETTQTFTQRTESNTITPEQEEVALAASKVNCLWMIEEIKDRGEVAKYYDNASKPYSDITKLGELWMQGNAGYSFKNESVTKFASYGEDLFSVFVSMDLVVTRNDGTERTYDFDKTLFFKDFNGTWKVTDWTNEDVSQPIGKVRLTFMNGKDQVHTDLFQNDLDEIVTPILQVPAGKVFSGWATLTEGDGSSVYSLKFIPDETGRVAIASGTVLEPMTLYAVFEDADATEGA